MKFKRAYTLSELFITMAIVGIIAALVVPGFWANMRKNIIASELAKSVSLVQNSMSELMNSSQLLDNTAGELSTLAALKVEDIFESAPEGFSLEDYIAQGQNLFSITSGVIGVEQVDNYDLGSILNYDGTDPDQEVLRNCVTYQFKKHKSIVILQDIPNLEDDIQDDQVITRVIIDADGPEGSNRFGEDVFLFGLTNTGLLVPGGSEAYNNNVYGDERGLYTQDCQDNIETGLSCAARVVTDGWKIKY